MAATETYRRWQAEEVAYLHEKYDDATAELIAKTLDRTLDSVYEKAFQEGLRKKRKSVKRDPDGPWLCPSCDKVKPKAEFHSKGDRGATYCKICTNMRQRERRKAK